MYTIMELFIFILSVSINAIRVYVRVWDYHGKVVGIILWGPISISKLLLSWLKFCIHGRKGFGEKIIIYNIPEVGGMKTPDVFEKDLNFRYLVFSLLAERNFWL